MKFAVTAAFLLCCGTVPASAVETPQPGRTDPRIQWIEYDPDQVIVLQGTIGYQVMLEFGPGERLENVAIGDALAWQVTPSKSAERLFLKPIDPDAQTNLTIVTNERRYLFELRVAGQESALVTPFVVRFNYPQPAIALPAAPEPEAEPQMVNTDYTISGAAENRPLRVFDDGHMVYFEWSPDAEVPAIFAVAADGSESIINYTVHGKYIVVDRLSPRFALRNGKQVMTVVNGELYKGRRRE